MPRVSWLVEGIAFELRSHVSPLLRHLLHYELAEFVGVGLPKRGSMLVRLRHLVVVVPAW